MDQGYIAFETCGAACAGRGCMSQWADANLQFFAWHSIVPSRRSGKYVDKTQKKD